MIMESRRETTEEGPFLGIKPRSAKGTGSKDRGVREEVRDPAGAGGLPGDDVSQPVSDESIQALIKDPQDLNRKLATTYSRMVSGRPDDLPQTPKATMATQGAIGCRSDLAARDGLAHERTVFEAYGRMYAELVQALCAKSFAYQGRMPNNQPTWATNG
jgi:hypothetical protein